MALPDLQAVKDRLRIDRAIEEEDADLEVMRASAKAVILEAVGRPLEAEEREFVVEEPRGYCDPWTTPCRSFHLPLYPVKHADPDLVTITDADDEEVTDFRVDVNTGRIIATNSTVFSNFPHTVTATVGLSLLPDYTTRVEPMLAQAFLDLIADWYQRRNPGALAEGAGGGVITQWQTLGVPERVCRMLDPYRLAKAW